MSKTKEEIFMNHATKLKGEYVMTEPSAMNAMDEYTNQRVTEVQDGLTREMHKLVMRVDELQEAHRWISVDEKLPQQTAHDMSDNVLVFTNFGSSTARYDYGLKRWNINLYKTVTHWQLLPEPPK